MKRATRLALVISAASICLAVAWTFTPQTLSSNSSKVEPVSAGLPSHEAVAATLKNGAAQKELLKSTPGTMRSLLNMSGLNQQQPTLKTDRDIYLPGETITFTGTDWAAGEAVTIVISAGSDNETTAIQAKADDSGSFVVTSEMPDPREASASKRSGNNVIAATTENGGKFLATATGASSQVKVDIDFTVGEANHDGERLLDEESYWIHRQTYPTRTFNPAWVRKAAEQDSRIRRGVPAGRKVDMRSLKNNPLALSPLGFTALGPQPERMTGCTGCFDYTTTAGRINDIKIDPTTSTNGSIVAYAASVGGGVWKTTNCCSAATTWTVKTDDALVSTTNIDSLNIDPNDHNTIYAGTGDLNFGSFSMGSQGILKSTDAGESWTVLGADVFGASLPSPAGQFPQYQAVGKVRVDPNSSNKVIAGTKTGLYLSYDGGTNWTGPCLTNSFSSMRQDITALELTNIAGVTRIIAAVGARGFATTVQYNLDQNGANGIYKGTMPASGCPSFTSIASNGNGFIYGVATASYAANANMNAGSGVVFGAGAATGDQLGRIDIGIAPSDPNVMYAQVQSIAPNNNSGGSSGGCANAAGCQLGAWVTTNGGTTWSFMAGSAGNQLLTCNGIGSSGAGDYPQNWYDQGVVVDPNNADRVFFDTYEVWLASRTGTAWYNTTCGYAGSNPHPVHVDQHALAFVPGSSSMLLAGNDGGVHGTLNANAATLNATRPTWFNMDTGFNTIEFYSGDISGNFATSLNPQAVGGAQDNGPSSVSFAGSPTGPVQWQMGLGGDGFFARVDPVGTGTSLRFWQGNNSGGLSRCILNCTNGGATWTSKRGNWTGDQQSFVLPFELFHGDTTNPANDCGAAGAGTGCGHLVAGTIRVWETITGAAANAGGTVTWYVNSPDNLTKGTLGNRSFINQLAFEPKNQNTVVVGTNDGNVQIGRGLGSGSGPTRAQGTITFTAGGSLAGEKFVIGSQTFTWQVAARSGPGQVQISTSATTSRNNVVAAVNADLAGVATAANSGTTAAIITAFNTGAAGNSITFTEASTNMAMNGSGTLGATTSGSDGAATWVNVTGGNTVLPNRPILDVAFDPTTTDAPIAYAAVGGFNENTPSQPGHVLRVVCTLNCGSFTWTDKSGNLPNIPVDSIIANPNFPMQVFAGSDFGLYYTDDITAVSPVWTRFNAGLPNVMIWDMAIDRGNTTLSLWTRSRGAYAWPLPLGPLSPLPTTLAVDPATGNYGGTVNLSATLTSGGNGVPGKSVSFTLNGNGVGSATTDGSGVATLSNVSLVGINGGLYPNGVGASFAGDSVYAPASGSNSLTVLQAPTITCPASFSVDADTGACATNVSFTGAHAATAIGYPVPTITYSPDSGTSFSVGTTTVTATATNSQGTDSCTFTVTVNDVQLPVVSNPTMSPSSLWPPNHQMVDVAVNYTATDNCPGLNCVLTVTSSEPIDGLGDGDTAPDWVVVSDHLVKLRSERSGKGKGRTYTVTTTCTDASGNITAKTSTLFVPANQKGALFPSSTAGTPLNATGGVKGAIGNQSFTPGTGWFLVPQGSYSLSPALSGKAEFSVESQALNREGQGLLSFSLGSLKFNSTDYEYCELTDSTGEFRGSGKLNGEDGYEFVLTVGDGQKSAGDGSDKSKIKIWNKSTGAVVFDSESGGSSGVKPPAVTKQDSRSKLKN
jgi:hypothetical protein